MARRLGDIINTGHAFITSRKSGKFSPKSKLLFVKAGPKFSKPTSQQLKIAEAGKACGAEIRGKFQGAGQVAARRAAMGACIRKRFAKA